jgi:hypothetical protein
MAKDKSKPKSAYTALRNEVCVGWGYCGCIKDGEPLHVDSFIPAQGTVTADQFVEWVFVAENLEPSLRPKSHWRGLRDAFVKHMGTSAVDASRLRWDAL